MIIAYLSDDLYDDQRYMRFSHKQLFPCICINIIVFARQKFKIC